MFFSLFTNLLDKLVSFAELQISYMIFRLNVLVVIFEGASTNLTEETLRLGFKDFLYKKIFYFYIHIFSNFLNFIIELFSAFN